MHEVILTPNAPKAIGPYSQAILASAGRMVFVSGQLGLDPESMQMVGSDAKSQAQQVLKNVAAVLAAGGAQLSDVVKTTIFLQDMNDFAAVNAVYEQFFGAHRPARATVQAARLPKDGLVEIEAIAVIS